MGSAKVKPRLLRVSKVIQGEIVKQTMLVCERIYYMQRWKLTSLFLPQPKEKLQWQEPCRQHSVNNGHPVHSRDVRYRKSPAEDVVLLLQKHIWRYSDGNSHVDGMSIHFEIRDVRYRKQPAKAWDFLRYWKEVLLLLPSMHNWRDSDGKSQVMTSAMNKQFPQLRWCVLQLNVCHQPTRRRMRLEVLSKTSCYFHKSTSEETRRQQPWTAM